MQKEIYLHVLWHQHQPWYLDPTSKTSIMPWVRLHGVKDYYDIAWLSQEYEGWKQTINLVPSLLKQLQLYTQGELTDSFLENSRKPAAELSQEEKLDILNNFFAGYTPQMVHPFPRYDELYRKRHHSADAVDQFSTQDYLDLQVWHNLTWIDPIWRDNPNYPLKSLLEKQRDFTEEDKQAVLTMHEEILAQVIPIHKKLYQEKKIDLTTTPYFHPILPLLCNSTIAQISNPGDPVPTPPFAFPEDADWQIGEGLNYFESIFGFRPQGMWPSEGSVSDSACALMAKAGVSFFATDEAILYRSTFFDPKKSMQSETLYQLHRLATAHGEIDCVFRNHSLSDRIGFVYQSWHPKEAAKDFVTHIKDCVKNWSHSTPPLVNVILDGENCWEFYPRDGHDFLRYTIEAILKDSQIQTTTVPEYRKKHPAKASIQSIYPGSWINHNFRIWVGHHEDNAAWHFLRLARETLSEHESQLDPATKEEAWKLLHIAEGSDWFWWYGDDNQSSYEDLFDSLFRSHIAAIYQLLGLVAPEALKRPIKQPKKVEKGGGIFFYQPDISAKQRRYYDWVGARKIMAKGSGGAMHQASDHAAGLRYGRFDGNLCFTVSLEDKKLLKKDISVLIHITKPVIKTVSVYPAEGTHQSILCKKRIEGIVDLHALQITPEEEIWFFLQINADSESAFTIPDGSELYLQGYTEANASIYWFV
jgi:alpha-amylase/alpha-mannosidase (GH57 family)